jgi:ATP-dependent Clp protease adapter protein ClpS
VSHQPPDRPEGSPEPPHRTGAREIPLYRLVLRTTADADMMSTVNAIMELIHLGKHEATHKMWEAHHAGQAMLLVTFRERAEFYVEQFALRGLTLAIEPL